MSKLNQATLVVDIHTYIVISDGEIKEFFLEIVLYFMVFNKTQHSFSLE